MENLLKRTYFNEKDSDPTSEELPLGTILPPFNSRNVEFQCLYPLFLDLCPEGSVRTAVPTVVLSLITKALNGFSNLLKLNRFQWFNKIKTGISLEKYPFSPG
jgi:hypothetical protein